METVIFFIISTLFLIPLVFILIGVIRSQKVKNYGDKYVLISNCDSRLARQLALRLVRVGFHVFAGYHPHHSMDADDIFTEKISARLIPLELDPSSPQSVKNALNALKNSTVTKGGLWALINTADMLGPAVPCEMSSIKDYVDVLDNNLYGPIEMSRLFLPLLRQAGGRIINISCAPSATTLMSFTHCPYAVSKSGIEGFSDMLRREVYRHGVNVCIVQTDTSYQQGDSDSTTDIAEETLERLDSCEDEVKHVYSGQFVQAFLKGCKMRTKGGILSTSCEDTVLQTYESAVTDRFPRTRYIIGNTKTKVLSRLFHYLPDWLVDGLLFYQLSKD